MEVIIFLFMAVIILFAISKEGIQASAHNDYKRSYGQRLEVMSRFAKESQRLRDGVSSGFDLLDYDAPHRFNEEALEEIAEVFDQIPQLRGMAIHIATRCPVGFDSNMRLAQLVYNANRGYIHSLDYMPFGPIFRRYSYYNEQRGRDEVLDLSYSTLSQFADIISKKYEEWGCPCKMVYTGDVDRAFVWEDR